MQARIEEGMTDRKAEGFLQERTETDAGMMEDLEHPVQQESEMGLEAAELEDQIQALQLRKKRKTVSYQRCQSSRLNTNIQTSELHTRRYLQRIRRPPDRY